MTAKHATSCVPQRTRSPARQSPAPRPAVSRARVGCAAAGRLTIAQADYQPTARCPPTTRLGWPGQEIEETVFFQAGGMALVLWGRDKLAADSGVEDPDPGAVALAQNVRSRAEVDAVLAEAAAAGAEITQPPRDTFYGGYAATSATPTATSGRSPGTSASPSTRTAPSPSPTSAPLYQFRNSMSGTLYLFYRVESSTH